MKVRIGIGASHGLAGFNALAQVGDAITEHGFDSLWLSESLTTPIIDPIIGLACAGTHNKKLKLGTTMLLPGRSPVQLAKQLASLDSLSGGRLLVTFVPGKPLGAQAAVTGGSAQARADDIEEAMPILRGLMEGRRVDVSNRFGEATDVTIGIRPTQDPFEFWLGGVARSSLERCGRLFDGWLPSRCTVERAANGRRVVEEAAAQANRSISSEHFGVSIAYSYGELSSHEAAEIAKRSGTTDIDKVVPNGLDRLRELMEQFVEVGFSKFVVRPIKPPKSWTKELDALANAVGDLQT